MIARDGNTLIEGKSEIVWAKWGATCARHNCNAPLRRAKATRYTLTAEQQINMHEALNGVGTSEGKTFGDKIYVMFTFLDIDAMTSREYQTSIEDARFYSGAGLDVTPDSVPAYCDGVHHYIA
jgi:hypothetical protein